MTKSGLKANSGKTKRHSKVPSHTIDETNKR